MRLVTRLRNRLVKHLQHNLTRRRYTRTHTDAVTSFCDNDYLGLSKHPKVVAALQVAAEHYGVSSTGSAMVTGYTSVHRDFEQAFAEHVGAERAMLFANGYLANMSILTCLPEKGDRLLLDKLCHASLIDGAGSSQGIRQRYRHRDTDHLHTLLTRPLSQGVHFIVSDTVFSMDGSICPVIELANLAQQHDASLILDDAHGFGVLGPQGRGTLAASGVELSKDDIVTYPLGKAHGTYGAMVTGSETMIEALTQFARGYMYNTALPAPLAAAGLASLKVMQDEPWHHEKLMHNLEIFKSAARQLNLPMQLTDTAIQPCVLHDEVRALRITQALQKQGIWVQAIRPPTVPTGTSRLRITISSCHDREDILRLVHMLQHALGEVESHV